MIELLLPLAIVLLLAQVLIHDPSRRRGEVAALREAVDNGRRPSDLVIEVSRFTSVWNPLRRHAWCWIEFSSRTDRFLTHGYRCSVPSAAIAVKTARKIAQGRGWCGPDCPVGNDGWASDPCTAMIEHPDCYGAGARHRARAVVEESAAQRAEYRRRNKSPK